MIDFAKVIDKKCKEKGIMKKDIAQILGISVVGLSYSINTKYPKLERLEEICNILNIPIWELFVPQISCFCPNCQTQINVQVKKAE